MAESRFNIGNFIKGVDKAFIQANIKKLKEVSTSVYIIPPMYTHRMDLLSNFLYRTTELKWLLLYVNDIVDISEVRIGYKLYYPEIQDILAVMNETKENT